MTRRDCVTLCLLVLVAVGVQLLGCAGVAHLRGSTAAYAYQSPDAAEYVALGRGLAWMGRYVRVDERGERQGGPDTWRTPGYPLVLAAVIRLCGDSTTILLAMNQILCVATVPLLWLLLRRFCAPGWAVLGAVGWCLDPFRIYYSLWLLAETLFTFALLITCLAWARGQDRGWSVRRAVGLGVLAGALVLIRPLAMLLPLLAFVGVFATGNRGLPMPPGEAGQPTRGRQDSPRRTSTLACRLRFAFACLLGIAVVLGPWLVRNRIVGGHWALSDQSGASFAYHKVVDVVLWSEHRAAWRFNAGATAAVRERIDMRVRELWEQAHGALSPQQRDELRWEKLNFGRAQGVDRFEASSLLWRAGMEMVRTRGIATIRCVAFQGVSMLTFPLGLLLAPPAGEGSTPLSMLGGGSSASRVASLGVGCAYLILVAGGLAAILHACVRRRWNAALFVALPALALLSLSLPSEDPRFRLPIVPLMWVMFCACKPACPSRRPLGANADP